MMQQRRDEILAKKAKLAELKRQRELRSKEISTRQSVGGSSSDVWADLLPLSFCR
jgi:dynein intermediate chain